MNKPAPEDRGQSDKNVSLKEPEIRTPEALSDWLDHSLAELVDQFEDFVTTNSTRLFFSR